MAALGEPPESALVLGAGGSARAVIWALREAGADVSVLARTPAGPRAWGRGSWTRPSSAECLVNCTPVGMEDPEALPPYPLGVHATVVDLVYAAGTTALLRTAIENGSRAIDGLEILAHQGALSFERWTGTRAPLDAMRLAARGDR
jgi:shikimate dehydrogenase